MKTWLKGGLIGETVFLVAIALQQLSIRVSISQGGPGYDLLFSLIFFFGENISDIGSFLIFMVGYFLAGTIVGLIIQNFRKNK